MDDFRWHLLLRNQIFSCLIIYVSYISVLPHLLHIAMSMVLIPELWEAPVASLQWMFGPANRGDQYAVCLVFPLTCCLCTKTKDTY